MIVGGMKSMWWGWMRMFQPVWCTWRGGSRIKEHSCRVYGYVPISHGWFRPRAGQQVDCAARRVGRRGDLQRRAVISPPGWPVSRRPPWRTPPVVGMSDLSTIGDLTEKLLLMTSGFPPNGARFPRSAMRTRVCGFPNSRPGTRPWSSIVWRSRSRSFGDPGHGSRGVSGLLGCHLDTVSQLRKRRLQGP
jgi:hypothetical protein